MKLRGIEFGNILGASGVQGFIGDGTEYPHHRIPFLRPDFSGMTFVAKTVTLQSRTTKDGANMSLNEDLQPTELFPKCIAINWMEKSVVNAVGLANTGIEEMLTRGCWQERKDPFLISFMSVASTPDGRRMELFHFVQKLKEALTGFQTPIGLQINFSCPNAGIDPANLLGEVEEGLRIASDLEIPLMPKFSITHIPVDAAIEISKDKNCDAVCVSNTIPWNDLPDSVKRKSFGSLTSPLRERGIKQDGGYSGPYMFPLVRDWVKEAVVSGIQKPINAGGGIFSTRDVFDLCLAGASSVFIGSVAMLRPWRVQKIIKTANELTWR